MFFFSHSRPGLLNASDSGYPWLADSWPTTSLPVNSGSGPNDINNFGRGGESTIRLIAALSRNLRHIEFMQLLSKVILISVKK